MRSVYVLVGLLVLALVATSGCGGGSGGGIVVVRLFAADGQRGVLGNLYEIDPATGNATLIGPIGYPVTGMAFDSGGTLYGITPMGGGVGPSATPLLIIIDVATGAGTPVGTLTDSPPADHGLTDCTFVGARLLGLTCPVRSADRGTAVEVDTTTGGVMGLGGPGIGGGGLGLAADASGTTYGIGTSGPTRTLYTVDPVTGALTTGPTVTGLTYEAVNAATFLSGTLFAVDASFGNGNPNNLVTIDPATGVATTIGSLPSGVDALAATQP